LICGLWFWGILRVCDFRGLKEKMTVKFVGEKNLGEKSFVEKFIQFFTKKNAYSFEFATVFYF
jgi:hypothetical protein